MRMRILATVGSVAVAAAVLSPTAAQAAPSSCTFKSVLPGRISIGQSAVGIHVPLTYSDPACATNFSASENLVRGNDDQFLFWTDDSRVETLTIYSGELNPGHYATTAEDAQAYTADYDKIPSSMRPAGTIIKFSARDAISVTRTSSSTVTIAVSTARYTAFDGFAHAGGVPVTIQQYNPTSKAWQTVKSATTNTGGGYSLSHIARSTASYRVTTPETAPAFATTSGTVRK